MKDLLIALALLLVLAVGLECGYKIGRNSYQRGFDTCMEQF